MADLSEDKAICSASELENGGKGVRFMIKQDGEAKPAFVVRYRDEVYAYLNQCGHQPMELDWGNAVFFDYEGEALICSTHGAMYSPTTGACLQGRCQGKGLTRIDVNEANGNVYLVPEHGLEFDQGSNKPSGAEGSQA